MRKSTLRFQLVAHLLIEQLQKVLKKKLGFGNQSRKDRWEGSSYLRRPFTRQWTAILMKSYWKNIYSQLQHCTHDELWISHITGAWRKHKGETETKLYTEQQLHIQNTHTAHAARKTQTAVHPVANAELTLRKCLGLWWSISCGCGFLIIVSGCSRLGVFPRLFHSLLKLFGFSNEPGIIASVC
jgi:hypothetical protein